MKPLSWKIGDARVTSVVEIEDNAGLIHEIITDATPENIAKIPWLKPHFVDENSKLKALVQSFVIETSSERIVVDTCNGNGRSRPGTQLWANLNSDFLERFENLFKRESITHVICTHLHLDHEGWNTMLVNGKYVPTFPNARYLFVEKEFEYWKNFPKGELEDDFSGIRESVLPVFDAGLVDLVPDDHKISSEVSLIPTPGHTPHHVSVLIKSIGKQAVITGDVLHHPCQIVHPEWKSFDTDWDTAYKSRKEFLERFADKDTLVIGTHFSGPVAGILERDGSSFRLEVRAV